MSHLYLCAVALATFGLVIAAPAHSQDAPIDEVAPDPPLSPEQQAQLAEWPPEKKLAYATWPGETKAYYWSLPIEQQALFWRLSDSDKVKLSTLPPADAAAAWKRLEEQANAEPAEPDDAPEPPDDVPPMM